jgi:serine/threonine-protein kinase
MIGQQIGYYEIDQELGDGGAGMVYKARDLKLRRDVAIRFLSRRATLDDEEWERVLIDIQAVAALNHPYITAVYDIRQEPSLGLIDRHDEDILIVMEFVEGRELADLMQSDSGKLLKIEDVLYFAKRIASGLKSAHKRKIYHGDVTSSNIWITPEGHVKIMNFGLARITKELLASDVSKTTRAISFKSPEQIRGKATDHRTDIWAFGVLLYEMFTGRLPFTGQNSQDIMESILLESPDPIYKSRGEIPIELEVFVTEFIRKDPDERPRNFSEVLRRLRAFSETD